MTAFDALIGSFHQQMAKPVAPRTSRLSALAILLGVVLANVVRITVRLKREALTLAGLGLLAAAAWQHSTIAGLAATGVACLVLEHLLSGD